MNEKFEDYRAKSLNDGSMNLNITDYDVDDDEARKENSFDDVSSDSSAMESSIKMSIIDQSFSSTTTASSVSSPTGTKNNKKQFLKYISLITLTIQNASLTLFMRAAKTQPVQFISSTAVIMAELLKLITCLVMVYRDEGKSFRKTWKVLKKTILLDPIDTLKVAVPAIVYYIQNNLIFLAATHLDPATSQVTYQLKILTTALFSLVLLKKKLILFQWLSLIILFVGVACVQLTQRKKISHNQNPNEQNLLIGFLAILTACFLSGFAGVYFEKILKNNSVISLWIRNIQLSAIAIPFGLIQVFVTDWKFIHEKGFFYGYTILTWTVIFLSAQGGLIVAVVVKYADNILKGFATSISIIISCIVSIYVFDFILTFQFFVGAFLVISSVFLYNKPDLFGIERITAFKKAVSSINHR
ncbi:midasin [Sarcoptes scabiei]|nr:midasin [Sarcoptes scabiei]